METQWPKCSLAINTREMNVSDHILSLFLLFLILEILDCNDCAWLVKLCSLFIYLFFMDGNLHFLFYAKSSSFAQLINRPTSGSLLAPSPLQLVKNTLMCVAWI